MHAAQDESGVGILRHRATLLLATAAVAGCGGVHGTLEVELVGAPGSDLLAAVQAARLHLDGQDAHVEVQRSPGQPLRLALDIAAVDRLGAVIFEGLDATGQLIAVGRTPPLPLSAIDGRLRLFVAAPLSVSPAPVELGSARTALGAAITPDGAVLAGGQTVDGTASDEFTWYSAYQHQLFDRPPLPEARSRPVVAADPHGHVYLLGGIDRLGIPRASAWRFAPDGQTGRFQQLASDEAWARAGEPVTALGDRLFLVAGGPPLLIDGASAAITPLEAAPALSGTLVTVRDADGDQVLAIGLGNGSTGALLGDTERFVELPAPASVARRDHCAVVLPGGQVLVTGGRVTDAPLRSAVLYDPASRSFTELTEFLARPRAELFCAVSSDLLFVGGGVALDGQLLAEAELFDPHTLQPLGSAALHPRRAATALVLPSQHVLIAGGIDAAGRPVTILELFTPFR
jgi:hypothetical protein